MIALRLKILARARRPRGWVDSSSGATSQGKSSEDYSSGATSQGTGSEDSSSGATSHGMGCSCRLHRRSLSIASTTRTKPFIGAKVCRQRARASRWRSQRTWFAGASHCVSAQCLTALCFVPLLALIQYVSCRRRCCRVLVHTRVACTRAMHSGPLSVLERAHGHPACPGKAGPTSTAHCRVS